MDATPPGEDDEYPHRCYRCGADIRPVPAADIAAEGGPYVARDGWAWCDDWIDHAPTPPADAKPGLWAVRVNETAITFCTRGDVVDWWFFQGRPPLKRSGHLHEHKPGFGGGLWWLGPWDWQGAEFIRKHMIDHGVPKGAVKLMRPPPQTPTRTNR